MHDRMQLAVDTLVSRGMRVCRCQPDEVLAIERALGRGLPQRFREYLLAMGQVGIRSQGTDDAPEDIPANTKYARTLVAEDPRGLSLPEDAIVFSMHQGYEFLFVSGGDAEDPHVYHYMEGSGEFKRVCERFSEYVLERALCHQDRRPDE